MSLDQTKYAIWTNQRNWRIQIHEIGLSKETMGLRYKLRNFKIKVIREDRIICYDIIVRLSNPSQMLTLLGDRLTILSYSNNCNPMEDEREEKNG